MYPPRWKAKYSAWSILPRSFPQDIWQVLTTAVFIMIWWTGVIPPSSSWLSGLSQVIPKWLRAAGAKGEDVGGGVKWTQTDRLPGFPPTSDFCCLISGSLDKTYQHIRPRKSYNSVSKGEGSPWEAEDTWWGWVAWVGKKNLPSATLKMTLMLSGCFYIPS